MLGVGNPEQRKELREYLGTTRPPVMNRAPVGTHQDDDPDVVDKTIDDLSVVDLTLLEIERRRQAEQLYTFDWNPFP